MPNWCNNNIRIYGDEGTISTLTHVINGLTSEDKLFESLIGLPDYMSKNQYEKEWYDTNIEWFGTKWDVNPEQHMFDFTKNEITFSCETAWSPPIPFLENLCKMYKVNAYIFYSEGGIGFSGETTFNWCDGELEVFDQEYEYQQGMYILSPEEFWSDMDSNLEYAVEEDIDLEDFIKDYKSYVSEEDLIEITNLYNEKKEEYESNYEGEGE